MHERGAQGQKVEAIGTGSGIWPADAGIMERTRGYPQEALEDMFLHLDMIEKKYGVGDTASVELSQEWRLSGCRARRSPLRLGSLKPD
jgi:hypothetical protein